MFEDNFSVDLLLFERKITVNKFYALMITAGVIASGVVGCGGEAPKKEEKKAAPIVPAVKKEEKKAAPEVKVPEVKKEEKAPEVKAPEVKAPEVKKEEKAPEVKKEEKK